MDNLVLVGFSCSGKTTLGRNLARRLRLRFVDSDRFLEDMTGRSIPDIFREDGEAGFREIEAEAIARITAERRQVISTGGGAFVNTPIATRCASATWSHLQVRPNSGRSPAQQSVWSAAIAARQPRSAGQGDRTDGRAQGGVLGRM